ncbi:MAG: carbohydrate binding domain-containing protein [Verrucomicrobia bacterium]|nr:carbohydrate binding domain-containing protein [Verrucomicrobiota bacterium]
MAFVFQGALAPKSAQAAENFFTNPSFEKRGGGEDGWHVDRDRGTVCQFAMDSADAAAGDRCVRVTIGEVKGWGTQFGQAVAGGQKGKTYTFAVLVKAVREPAPVRLQIERRAKPYDRVMAGEEVTLGAEGWTELHHTFKAERDYPERWFAYISCRQASCEYRADMFRLYEGDYVPYKQLARKQEEAEAVRLFDTTASLPAAFSGVVCKGDLCAANSYLALVLREGAKGPECYYRLGEKMVKGLTLVAAGAGGDKARVVDSFKVIENTARKIILEANATTEAGRKIVARYTVKRGQPIIEIQTGDGAERILVEARAKYVVLPDPFCGDLLISANDTQAARLRFPSEHMLLELLEDRNAIVMSVWRSVSQQVNLHLDGSGNSRAITVAEIGFPKESGPAVWVAVLAAPDIWHEKRQGDLHPVKDTKLDWKVPFRAAWRADYQRTDRLTDSWKCPIRVSTNRYEGVGFELRKARTIWTSARGSFAYPPCIEGDTCFLRKTKFEPVPDIQYDDNRSAVIYPFGTLDGSPAGAFGAMDVLAAALEGTPKASLPDDLHIKRVERDKWPATCAVTGEYEKIFDAGEEKAKKQFLLERLDAMHNFVINIRSRMNEFLDWGRKTHAWLTKTKADQPQLAALADEFDSYLAEFGKIYERRKLDERTPPAARLLIDKVIPLIDSDEHHEKKLEKIKQLGRDTRTIGGNQDSAIGEFRMFSKRLRQRAGIRMTEAKDDEAFEFAREMRQRTMEVLYCAFGHESAAAD